MPRTIPTVLFPSSGRKDAFSVSTIFLFLPIGRSRLKDAFPISILFLDSNGFLPVVGRKDAFSVISIFLFLPIGRSRLKDAFPISILFLSIIIIDIKRDAGGVFTVSPILLIIETQSSSTDVFTVSPILLIIETQSSSTVSSTVLHRPPPYPPCCTPHARWSSSFSSSTGLRNNGLLELE